MKDEEHWQELCRQASVEQDPKKLMTLVAQINELLDEKQKRLNRDAGGTNEPTNQRGIEPTDRSADGLFQKE
jgi:hypothetical protein